MNMNLKPVQLLFPLRFIFMMAALLFGSAAALTKNFTVADTLFQPTNDQPSFYDTIKYNGYRLNLTEFEILKKTDDWVKIKCTIVNSGRNDVDFSKKGTEHWVQVNFDQSLFDNKLGGLRENIRQAMYDENLRLTVGEVIRGKTLKVSTMPVASPRNNPAPAISFSDPTHSSENKDEIPAVFSSKGGDNEAFVEPAEFQKEKTPCPDLFFSNLRVLEQDDKWATVEYTVENQGEGAFQLAGSQGNHQERLAIRAYISGVAVLSRGALPIGGQFVRIEPGEPKELYPGGRYTGKLRLDVRKKTRYLKSLILSLESDQFHLECDKTNNTGAVILD
jgi:hypothetical protein